MVLPDFLGCRLYIGVSSCQSTRGRVVYVAPLHIQLAVPEAVCRLELHSKVGAEAACEGQRKNSQCPFI